MAILKPMTAEDVYYLADDIFDPNEFKEKYFRVRHYDRKLRRTVVVPFKTYSYQEEPS